MMQFCFGMAVGLLMGIGLFCVVMMHFCKKAKNKDAE